MSSNICTYIFLNMRIQSRADYHKVEISVQNRSATLLVQTHDFSIHGNRTPKCFHSQSTTTEFSNVETLTDNFSIDDKIFMVSKSRLLRVLLLGFIVENRKTRTRIIATRS